MYLNSRLGVLFTALQGVRAMNLWPSGETKEDGYYPPAETKTADVGGIALSEMEKYPKLSEMERGALSPGSKSSKVIDDESAVTIFDAPQEQYEEGNRPYITLTDVKNCVTCQCTFTDCCHKSCCCACDTLTWCTGVKKWKFIATFVLLFLGFIGLCVYDYEIGMTMIDLLVAVGNWLVSPFGQIVLAAVLMMIFGKAIFQYVKSKFSSETFRNIANTIKNLPTPVKVLGGVLAAAALVPFLGPAILPILAGGAAMVGSAALAVSGVMAVAGTVGGVIWSIGRGNRETNNLIKHYGETLIADIGHLQHTVDEGLKMIEQRLQAMEDKIVAEIR